MVAVPDMCAGPVTVTGGAELAITPVCRRAVAIAETTMELLRPESDLLRVVTDVGLVDLLVVSDVDRSDVDPSDVDTDFEDDDGSDGSRGEIAAEVARLGLPGLHVHHLALRPPLTAGAEPDLVAALSELVGFDPEPGVFCLAPPAGDGSRSALASAAQRIAQVYGIPLLRYRCLALTVVPEQRAQLASGTP
jgi:hypothetical protein